MLEDLEDSKFIRFFMNNKISIHQVIVFYFKMINISFTSDFIIMNSIILEIAIKSALSVISDLRLLVNLLFFHLHLR